jgi:hypothetical protein
LWSHSGLRRVTNVTGRSCIDGVEASKRTDKKRQRDCCDPAKAVAAEDPANCRGPGRSGETKYEKYYFSMVERVLRCWIKDLSD